MVDRGSIIDPSSQKDGLIRANGLSRIPLTGELSVSARSSLRYGLRRRGIRKLEEEERREQGTDWKTQYGQGGAPEILSVLYQFQFAGDLGALERQGGMIRQQLLEKLHRALIGGANFDGFDQT